MKMEMLSKHCIPTTLDCAKFFKVSRTLIYSRLSDNKSVIFEGKHVFITKK